VSAGAVAASYVDVAAAVGTASLTLGGAGSFTLPAAGAASLTLTGVHTPWAAYVASLTPDLWWRLGETTGAVTAADSSGNSRTGTIVNAPTMGVAGAVAGSNTAMTFNGTNQRVSSGAVATIWGAALSNSVSFFIKWTSTAAVTVPVSLRANDGLNPGITMQFTCNRTAGFLNVESWMAATSTTRVFSTGTLNDGNWHHIVGTINGTSKNLKLYVDGVLHGTIAQTGGTFNTTDRQIWAGAGQNGGTGANFFPGSIDEVIVDGSTEWTATQVTDLYAARL
jgi:hypothetical protein